MARILVVEDQETMRRTLARMLRGANHEVHEAGDGIAGSEVIRAEEFDLVLTDLRLGPRDGLDLLRLIKETQPLAEVIVMTAYGTIESAVEAMRLGAYDYLPKPFSEDELRVKVDRALEKRRLVGEVSLLAAEFRERYRFDSIIGRSPGLSQIIARIHRFAPTDATVLITGESGTGKELVAKALHAHSGRASRPFVPINCAALPPELLESEVFGHVRGAFTGAIASRKGLFEEADGGTFFFDEIGEIPPPIQAKLLRAIQEHEIRRVGENHPIRVDVRVIAATNQDLDEAIAAKRFRPDLYYRLNVARLHLPPLRERREDISLLVEHFLDKHGQATGRRARIGRDALTFLLQYDFPGNVRELENLIAQGLALSASDVLHLDDVVPVGRRWVERSATSTNTLDDVVSLAERLAIEGTLEELHGNREASAEKLGLSTTTLWRKMKRHGLR